MAFYFTLFYDYANTRRLERTQPFITAIHKAKCFPVDELSPWHGAFPRATKSPSRARPFVIAAFQSVATNLAIADLLLPQLPPHKMIPPWASKFIIDYSSLLFLQSANNDILSNLTSTIVTLVVGAEQRLFAAHEDVLCTSPFFSHALRNTYMDPTAKRIALPDEEPEIFSSVLEYLYKGDYFPRVTHNKRRNSWELEPTTSDDQARVESTVYLRGVEGDLLKDTVIYCAAERYGLSDLKKLALRKQGLRESCSYLKHDLFRLTVLF